MPQSLIKNLLGLNLSAIWTYLSKIFIRTLYKFYNFLLVILRMLFSTVDEPRSLCTVCLSGAGCRAEGRLSSAELLEEHSGASGRVARAAGTAGTAGMCLQLGLNGAKGGSTALESLCHPCHLSHVLLVAIAALMPQSPRLFPFFVHSKC